MVDKKRNFLSIRLLLLGSGELGKELVIEAKRLGCEVIAIDKYEDAPAMQLADSSYVIDMNDKNALKNIILDLKPDYIVPEIESLSIEALKDMENEGFKIVPNARTVEMTMNRDKIRDLASRELKILTANYKYVYEKDNLLNQASKLGFPIFIKPLMSSSGKGQNFVENESQLLNAWENALLNSRGNVQGVILEEFIDFTYEFTLLSVRTTNGENIFCEPIGHQQYKGDYQCSWQPIPLEKTLIDKAKRISNTILDNLNGAGIYGIEFFVKNDQVIFSELSPRPHDTGMVTLISQNINEFELHLRAFLGLPIPRIKIYKPAASRVILSNDLYEKFIFKGLSEALKIKDSKVFIFGKPIAKKGRRMGVALASGENIQEARNKADSCANEIKIICCEK